MHPFRPIIILFLLCICLLPLNIKDCSRCYAQTRADYNANPLVTISFYQVPIETALSRLFRKAEMPNGLDLQVKLRGNITGKYERKPIQDILKEILKQSKVPATYQVRGQTYIIEAAPSDQEKASSVFQRAEEKEGKDIKRPELILKVGHANDVTMLAFSPDGERFISSSREGITNLWNLGTQTLVRAFEGLASPGAFTADGSQVVTIQDKHVCFWQVSTGRLLTIKRPFNDRLYQAVPSPKKETPEAFVATGRMSGQNNVVFFPGGNKPSVFTRTTWPCQVAFTPDGRFIFGWTSTEVYLWKVEDGKMRFIGKIAEDAPNVPAVIRQVCLSPDQRWLAVVGEDGTVHLYPLDLSSVNASAEPAKTAVVSEKKSQTPVIGPEFGMIQCSPRKSPEYIRTPQTSEISVLENKNKPNAARSASSYIPMQCAFQPGQSAVLAVTLPKGSEATGRIVFFDLQTGRRTGDYLAGHPAPYSNWGTCAIAFAPKGDTLISSGYATEAKERRLLLWNLNTSKQITAIDYNSYAIRFLSLVGEGDQHLVAGGEHGIWLWDMTMVTPPQQLPIRLPLAVSSNHELLAAPDDNPNYGAIIAPEKPRNTNPQLPMIDSSDLGDRGEDYYREMGIPIKKPTEAKPVTGVSIWNMSIRRSVRVLLPYSGAQGQCKAIQFSKGGEFVFASGWSDNRIYLWSAQGWIVHAFSGQHQDPIKHLQLSGSDSLLLSQDTTGMIVLWDTVLGKARAVPQKQKLFKTEEFVALEKTISPNPAPYTPFDKFPVSQRDRGNEVKALLGGAANLYTADNREVVPLATVSLGKVRCYNAWTGETILLNDGSGFKEEIDGDDISFTPNGIYLLVSNSEGTTQYDLRTRERAGWFPLVGQITAHRSKSGGTVLIGQRVNDPRRPAWSTGQIAVPFTSGHMQAVTSMCVALDGRFIVTGSFDGTVRLWDRGKEVATYIGIVQENNLKYRTIAVNRQMPVPSQQMPRSNRQLPPNKAKKINKQPTVAQILESRAKPISGEYIVAQPDNSYMASKGALDQVSFRVGDNDYPFEQFDLRLNRPDKVLTTLKTFFPSISAEYIQGKAQAHAARLAKFGLMPADLKPEDLELPTIAFKTPIPQEIRTRQVQFTVEAQDKRYPLSHFQIYVNGSYVDLPNLTITNSSTGMTVERTYSIALTPGKNVVEVFAVNKQLFSSLKLLRNIQYNPPRNQIVPPRLFVFTVGVSRYADPGYKLEWCHKDAIDLSQTLRQLKTKSGTSSSFYADVIVEPPLCDQNAKREAILQKLEIFMRQTRPEDSVIILLAGHGQVHSITKTYYFGCYDWQVNNLEKTAVSFEQIDDILKKAPARRKLLLMDTCHSGEVSTFLPTTTDVPKIEPIVDNGNQGEEASGEEDLPNLAATSPQKGETGLRGVLVGTAVTSAQETNRLSRDWAQVVQELFVDVDRGSGAEVLSAASGLQQAQELKGLKHGVFTYCLLVALERGQNGRSKADSNKDGIVTSTELLQFITQETIRITNKDQHPTARRKNMGNMFSLWTGNGMTIQWPKTSNKK